jgi:hypothetical protein
VLLITSCYGFSQTGVKSVNSEINVNPAALDFDTSIVNQSAILYTVVKKEEYIGIKMYTLDGKKTELMKTRLFHVGSYQLDLSSGIRHLFTKNKYREETLFGKGD